MLLTDLFDPKSLGGMLLVLLGVVLSVLGAMGYAIERSDGLLPRLVQRKTRYLTVGLAVLLVGALLGAWVPIQVRRRLQSAITL